MAKAAGKSNTKLLIVFIIIIIAAIIYVSWDKIKTLWNKQKDTTVAKTQGTITAASGKTVPKTVGNLNLDKPLKMGMPTCEEVRMLQKILNVWIAKPVLTEDGIWGKATEAKYQTFAKPFPDLNNFTPDIIKVTGGSMGNEPVTLNQVLKVVMENFGCDDPHNCPVLDLLIQIFPANF